MASILLHDQSSGTKAVVKAVITEQGSPQGITGFEAPASGSRLLILIFAFDTAIYHDNVGSAAGNRIYKPGGLSCTVDSILTLIYDAPYWRVVSYTENQ